MICRRAIILAPLVLSLSAPGQADSLDRGLELYRQEKYEAALEQFEEARRLQPTNAAIDNFIGITETKLGRLDEANKDYEKASRIDPRLAGPHTNLGFNYLGRKQYDLAEKQLRTALALDSADSSAHYYLAVLYLTTAREKEALPHIEPATPLLENDSPAAVLAIKACLQYDAPAEASRLIDFLEQRPRLSAEQKYEVALALIKARQTKHALPLLASLTAEHASDASLLSSIASVYESAGESSLALEAWQKAIAADPANPDHYLDCTRLLIDLDRYQEAAGIVRRGIALVPDDYPLTIRLGAIEMMTGDHDKARESYRKAIAEHPELALGYVAVAQSYMKEGRDEEALKVLTDARVAVPRDFALEYVFGLVSLQLDRQSEAMESLKSAEEMQPSVVEPHYQLGLLYMKRQQWKEAREEFEQVLKLDRNNAPAYYQLSRTYQRLGEVDKAQQMAKQASLLTRTQREDAIKTQQLRFGIPDQN